MTTTFTVLPDVGGRFLVRDGNDGWAIKRMYLPILTEPFTITISPQDRAGKSNKEIIREKLREMIEVEIEVGMAQDINFLVEEEEGSPPIKILREQDWRQALRTEGRNTFQIIRMKRGGNTINTSGFGKERIFKLAPYELRYDETNYFEPDKKSMLLVDANTEEQASCAFQYIYQRFGKVKGFIKKARDFQTIKRLSQTDPPQFRNWIAQYQKEVNLEKLGLNTQYPVIELESFEDELFKVDVMEVEKDNWTKEEEYNSMSVLDIVRWCMWAGVSCYVVDYDGHYYLSYNHGQIIKSHTDRKTNSRKSMVLKVVNNHAYFVEDPNLKISVSNTLTKYNCDDFGMDLTGGFDKDKEKDTIPEEPEDTGTEEWFDWEDKMKDWIKERRSKFYQSPYFKVKQMVQDKKFNIYDEKEWMPYSDIDPAEDLDGCLKQIAQTTYKNNPPPLPQDFLNNINTTYYLEPTSLNGIVSYIHHNFGILPDTMNGSSPHKIDRVSYGKTKLMSRRCNPNLYGENNIEDINYLYKNFPELSLNRIPTITAIAEQIFKKYYKDKKYYSMFNSNTKRAFFDGEIKADNRVVKENPNSDIFSIDLKRAYSRALVETDVEWGVYDGISQFQYCREFKTANAFYLVEEKVDEYPLRGVEGLVLYHGCFLRRVLDKVDIKFIIRPARTKKKDYFKTFYDKCLDLDEETRGITPSKYLINNFIGSMKKQDTISNYTIKATQSDTTITRAFYTGSIVSNLDKNTKWNEDYRFGEDKKRPKLIGNPIYQKYIMSAQPIRLQIIDSVNEKLYKLYLDYKITFGRCPLVMTRTDALYIECEDDDGFEKKDNEIVHPDITPFCENNSILCELESICPKDCWEYQKTPTTQKQVYSKRNKWETQININKPWSLNYGAKALFNIIHTGGGAMVNGEAGVGKSELVNYISNKFEKNLKLYRWVKMITKLVGFNPIGEQEDWRNSNPCYCVKLAPTNKATNRIGGKTLNRGLGIPVLEFDDEESMEDEVGYFEKLCVSICGGYDKGRHKPCVDYILIDEDSMINGYFWSILLAIKHRAPRIKFILCGDIKRQLPPVGEEHRNFMGAYLIKELANFQQLNLNYNFRNKLKGNILWDDWSKHPERFKIDADAPMTTINLCYFNKTRKRIIGIWNDILKPLGNKLSFETEGTDGINFEDDGQTPEIYFTIGTPMISCKTIKDYGVAKNEMWNIIRFDDDNIVLEYEDRELELSREEVYKNFYSGYAITIHKSQGDTYEDKYTIWDWLRLSKREESGIRNRFNRKLRYVAQSRSKKPEKNILYKE